MILTNCIQQRTVTLRVCNYRLIVPLASRPQEQTAEDKWIPKFITVNSYSFSEGKNIIFILPKTISCIGKINYLQNSLYHMTLLTREVMLQVC
jgi:hypothetical protein